MITPTLLVQRPSVPATGDTPPGPVSPMPGGADLPADFDPTRRYLSAPAAFVEARYEAMVGPLTASPQRSLAEVVREVAG